ASRGLWVRQAREVVSPRALRQLASRLPPSQPCASLLEPPPTCHLRHGPRQHSPCAGLYAAPLLSFLGRGDAMSHPRFRAGEKRVQRRGGCFGRRFGKEVTGIERASLHIVAPGSPQREWSALIAVPRIERSVRAPQDEKRTADAASCGAIGLI